METGSFDHVAQSGSRIATEVSDASIEFAVEPLVRRNEEPQTATGKQHLLHTHQFGDVIFNVFENVGVNDTIETFEFATDHSVDHLFRNRVMGSEPVCVCVALQLGEEGGVWFAHVNVGTCFMQRLRNGAHTAANLKYSPASGRTQSLDYPTSVLSSFDLGLKGRSPGIRRTNFWCLCFDPQKVALGEFVGALLLHFAWFAVQTDACFDEVGICLTRRA